MRQRLSVLVSCQPCVAHRSTGGSPRKTKAPRRDSRSNASDAAPGTKARTVVVVTVAPGASDTEHTLNTLRNACMMAGLEPNAASESRTEVPLVDNGGRRPLRGYVCVYVCARNPSFVLL
jgi:hypothetical protein